ncbi:MAG TPA: hypothetical protein VKO66_00990 [Sideroxyarcus sp.]|nr:hypothetical protein [Sideroxyarcus sp.]
MRFETLMRTLLLGAALAAAPAPAAEIAVPAERPNGSEITQRPSVVRDVSNSQQQRPAAKTKRKTSDHKAATDTAASLSKNNVSAGTSADAVGETVPENIPAEPPHLALRGVRG